MVFREAFAFGKPGAAPWKPLFVLRERNATFVSKRLQEVSLGNEKEQEVMRC